MKRILFICAITIFVSSLRAQEKEDFFKLGGAIRFNTSVENYEKSNKALNTYIKLDTWYLSADAHKSGFDLSFQYRFYPDSKAHFLHHGYIGYQIDQSLYIKGGVFQKPFGIGDFASHSWWFQIPYYMGLEDTYNTGIGLSYQLSQWRFDFAYFRQAAPKGFISDNTLDNDVGNGRYSYAVVPTTGYVGNTLVDANIRELDQFNLRARYKLNENIEFGVSGQLGSIYNKELNSRKWGISTALHIVADYNKWNFKGEFISYNYNAQGNNKEKLDILQMAAYGAAYDVAAKGNIYVLGLAYMIPINRKFIKYIQPYIDYSIVDKHKKEYFNTQHLIPGALVSMGPIYTYVDFALGKNQPWLTSNFGEGLGKGTANARWNSRFNINIGYYFNQ